MRKGIQGIGSGSLTKFLISVAIIGSKRGLDVQSTMPNTPTRHPYHQPSHIPTRRPLPEPPFCSLIHQLVESRVHIIRKLYLRNRLHPLRCAPYCKTYDPLLAQWGVENSFGAEFRSEIHAAAEDAPESDVFAEEEDTVIGAEGVGEGAIDGLEEIETGTGGGGGEVWVSLEGGGRVVEEGVGGVVDGEVKTGGWRVGGVEASLWEHSSGDSGNAIARTQDL